MSNQNKYYYTAEIKAQHEFEVGSKWHFERNKVMRKEQLDAFFAAGGSQCSNPDCGMLFMPDDQDKYIASLRQNLTAAEQTIAEKDAELAVLEAKLKIAISQRNKWIKSRYFNDENYYKIQIDFHNQELAAITAETIKEKK